MKIENWKLEIDSRGEIATLLTFFSVGLMMLGIAAGSKLAQTGGRLNPLAAVSNPTTWPWYEADANCAQGNKHAQCMCAYISTKTGDPDTGLCAPAPVNPPKIDPSTGRTCMKNPWDDTWGCWGKPGSSTQPSTGPSSGGSSSSGATSSPPGTSSGMCYSSIAKDPSGREYGVCDQAEGSCHQRLYPPGDPDYGKFFKCVTTSSGKKWMGPCSTKADCEKPPTSGGTGGSSPPGGGNPPIGGEPAPVPSIDPNDTTPRYNGFVVIRGSISSPRDIAGELLTRNQLIRKSGVQLNVTAPQGATKIGSGIQQIDASGNVTFANNFGQKGDYETILLIRLDDPINIAEKFTTDFTITDTKDASHNNKKYAPTDASTDKELRPCFPFPFPKEDVNKISPTPIPLPDPENAPERQAFVKKIVDLCAGGKGSAIPYINSVALDYSKPVGATPAPGAKKEGYYVFSYKFGGFLSPNWTGYSYTATVIDSYFAKEDTETAFPISNVFTRLLPSGSSETFSNVNSFIEITDKGYVSKDVVILQSKPNIPVDEASTIEPNIKFKVKNPTVELLVNPYLAAGTSHTFIAPCFPTITNVEQKVAEIKAQCPATTYYLTLPESPEQATLPNDPNAPPAPGTGDPNNPPSSSNTINFNLNIKIQEPGGTKTDDKLEQYTVPPNTISSEARRFHISINNAKTGEVVKYLSFDKDSFSAPVYGETPAGQAPDGKTLYHAYQSLKPDVRSFTYDVPAGTTGAADESFLRATLSMNPSPLWCGISPSSVSPLEENISYADINNAKVSNDHTIYVSYFLDCQNGPYGSNSEVEITGSTNDKFLRAIDLWTKGSLDVIAMSSFINQLTRYPGLQQVTCEPFLPPTNPSSCQYLPSL